MKPETQTLYVVAPSYRWFESWCWDRQLNPRDRHAAIFVRDQRDVQGIRLESEAQIIDLGSFDPKRYELVLALSSRVRSTEGRDDG